jgi:hypothetical protein
VSVPRFFASSERSRSDAFWLEHLGLDVVFLQAHHRT